MIVILSTEQPISIHTLAFHLRHFETDPLLKSWDAILLEEVRSAHYDEDVWSVLIDILFTVQPISIHTLAFHLRHFETDPLLKNWDAILLDEVRSAYYDEDAWSVLIDILSTVQPISIHTLAFHLRHFGTDPLLTNWDAILLDEVRSAYPRT